MKLGSLKEGGRDGTLIVVSRDLSRGVRATGIADTLQRALEDWSNTAPRLNALYDALNAGNAEGAFDVDMAALAAPLPRRAARGGAAQRRGPPPASRRPRPPRPLPEELTRWRPPRLRAHLRPTR